MISKLRGLYNGKSIAILGSAPTIQLYDESEDLTIAVNGALQLNKRIDYFVTSHPVAFRKSWFNLKPDVSRIINSVSAIFYEPMYPDTEVRDRLTQKYIESMKDTFQFDDETGEKFNVLFRELPEPASPHRFFYFGDLNIEPMKRVSKLQKDIFAGGTSACAALQLANIMGASEIHLYGCSFSNTTRKSFNGNNYFYKAKVGEMGQTNDKQRIFMDETIKSIANGGTKVYAHGFTNLKEPVIIP